jgi:hypothetical protein
MSDFLSHKLVQKMLRLNLNYFFTNERNMLETALMHLAHRCPLEAIKCTDIKTV